MNIVKKIALSALAGTAASGVIGTLQVAATLTAPFTWPLAGMIAAGAAAHEITEGDPLAVTTAALAGLAGGAGSVVFLPIAPLFIPMNMMTIGVMTTVGTFSKLS